MCGLAGVILKKEDRSQADLSSIQNGFKSMLLKANVRGGHATGFALIDKYGGYIIVKRPLDSKEFLKDNITSDAFELLSDDITCILGHTRYATLGKPAINKNNHPIRTGNTIGTHNGSIQNHKELFKKYNMNRHAQVDSEAIFRLYDTSESAKDLSENRLPNVRGKVAIVWSDLEYPEYVYMVKGNNPLEMVFLPHLNALAYGSTTKIIKASGWTKFEPIKLTANTMYRINTNTLKIRSKSIKIQKPKYPKYNYGSGFSFNSSIGAYVKTTPITRSYENTVPEFIPRYTNKDQIKLFKKVKASDGSTIRKIK